MTQAALPCTYYPRLEDCFINQVLFQGLRLASSLTDDSMLRIKLYRLVSRPGVGRGETVGEVQGGNGGMR